MPATSPPSPPARATAVPRLRARGTDESRPTVAPLPTAIPAGWSRELTEAAPVIRSVLERLQGRPVLIVNPDNAPVTNGSLALIDRTNGALLPALSVEFTLRGLVFALEIPLGRVFDLVGSWTGTHFVFRLPGDWFWLGR